MADRLRAPMPASTGVDDAHLGHQPFVRHIGPAPGDLRIVQRQVREPLLTVPPREFPHLGRADLAVAVVDDDVGFWALGGRREGDVGRHAEWRGQRSGCSEPARPRARRPAVFSARDSTGVRR